MKIMYYNLSTPVLLLSILCLISYFNSFQTALIADDYVHYYLIRHFTEQRLFLQHNLAVFLHIGVVLLVFAFLKLFFSFNASFVGAAIFAVHPIHIEAVTWLTGLRYVYGTFFILIVYLLYKHATSGKIKQNLYLVSIVIYAFCILAHYLPRFYEIEKKIGILPAPNAVFYLGFPFFLMLSEWYFKQLKQKWRLSLPFFIPVFFYLYFVQSTLIQRLAILSSVNAVNWSIKIYYAFLKMFYGFGVFWGMMLLPIKLAFFHEPIFIYLDKILLLLCIIFILFKRVLYPRYFRQALFILGFWLIFSWPLFNPITISPVFSEKYFYITSIGFCMAICLILERIIQKSFIIFCLISIVLIGGYSVRTILRNYDYTDELRFWQAEIKAVPKSWHSWNNLGTAYIQNEQYEKALLAYRQALLLQPAGGEVSTAKVNFETTLEILREKNKK